MAWVAVVVMRAGLSLVLLGLMPWGCKQQAPATDDKELTLVPAQAAAVAGSEAAPQVPNEPSVDPAQLQGRTHVPKDLGDPERCKPCHPDPSKPDLKNEHIDALCRECHEADRHPDKSHKSDIQMPVGMTTWLPLAPGGRIGCHTCHDPHGTTKNIYQGGDQVGAMCRSCHSGH